MSHRSPIGSPTPILIKGGIDRSGNRVGWVTPRPYAIALTPLLFPKRPSFMAECSQVDSEVMVQTVYGWFPPRNLYKLRARLLVEAASPVVVTERTHHHGGVDEYCQRHRMTGTYSKRHLHLSSSWAALWIAPLKFTAARNEFTSEIPVARVYSMTCPKSASRLVTN